MRHLCKTNPISKTPKPTQHLMPQRFTKKTTYGRRKKTNPIKPNLSRHAWNLSGLSPVFCLLSSVFCPLSLCAYVPLPLCTYESIMQNKPNLQNPKTTATSFPSKTYPNIPPRPTRKNKPNSNPIMSLRSPKRSRIPPRNTRYAIRDTKPNPPTTARPQSQPTPRPQARQTERKTSQTGIPT